MKIVNMDWFIFDFVKQNEIVMNENGITDEVIMINTGFLLKNKNNSKVVMSHDNFSVSEK